MLNRKYAISAIDAQNESGYSHCKAVVIYSDGIGNETIGRDFVGKNLKPVFMETDYAWTKWGADRKAERMKERHKINILVNWS
ncbi:MAG: hypothetical protein JW754_04525 [Candidatus Aenigmarchaeota archaeon]|nr:hypothetical protein [Candidatus Aenigmarchaeota archaeon]